MKRASSGVSGKSDTLKKSRLTIDEESDPSDLSSSSSSSTPLVSRPKRVFKAKTAKTTKKSPPRAAKSARDPETPRFPSFTKLPTDIQAIILCHAFKSTNREYAVDNDVIDYRILCKSIYRSNAIERALQAASVDVLIDCAHPSHSSITCAWHYAASVGRVDLLAMLQTKHPEFRCWRTPHIAVANKRLDAVKWFVSDKSHWIDHEYQNKRPSDHLIVQKNIYISLVEVAAFFYDKEIFPLVLSMGDTMSTLHLTSSASFIRNVLFGAGKGHEMAKFLVPPIITEDFNLALQMEPIQSSVSLIHSASTAMLHSAIYHDNPEMISPWAGSNVEVSRIKFRWRAGQVHMRSTGADCTEHTTNGPLAALQDEQLLCVPNTSGRQRAIAKLAVAYGSEKVLRHVMCSDSNAEHFKTETSLSWILGVQTGLRNTLDHVSESMLILILEMRTKGTNKSARYGLELLAEYLQRTRNWMLAERVIAKVSVAKECIRRKMYANTAVQLMKHIGENYCIDDADHHDYKSYCKYPNYIRDLSRLSRLIKLSRTTLPASALRVAVETRSIDVVRMVVSRLSGKFKSPLKDVQKKIVAKCYYHCVTHGLHSILKHLYESDLH